jgi:hypothetical protein
MMSEEQKIVLMLKGLISEAPQDIQDKITNAAERIRAIVNESVDEGNLAVALVGAEIGANNA